jgi:hypothetical protein
MNRYGVECPECGSPRTRKVAGLTFGRANDGSVPVRRYGCADCDTRYLVAALVLPAGTSISALDEDVRARGKMKQRREHGYWGTGPRGGFRLSSDRLEIRVRLVPGQRLGHPTQKGGSYAVDHRPDVEGAA